MWFGFWTLAFLVSLAVIVALTLLVENWGRWRQPVASVSALQVPAGLEQLDDDDAIETERTEGVPELPPPREIRLNGRTAADRLVAALFASYAAQRLPEANRVAAWVTASERPPSGDGSICDPGTSLRGRPAAVQRLLELDEEGRTWVTLNEGVDIGLGVSRRPPTCGVLGSVVQLWEATRQNRTELSGHAAAELASAIDALRPTWSTTTAAAIIGPIAEVLADVAASAPAPRVVLTVAAPGRADRVDRDAASCEAASGQVGTAAEVVPVVA